MKKILKFIIIAIISTNILISKNNIENNQNSGVNNNGLLQQSPLSQIQVVPFNLPNALAFSPDGSYCAVAGNNNNVTGITIYNVNGTNGQFTPIQTIASGRIPIAIAYSSDGKVAATCNFVIDSTVSVYSVNQSSGQFTLAQTTTAGINPYKIAFSPLGQIAAVVSSGNNQVNGSISVYNLLAGQFNLIQTIICNDQPQSIAFSSTGKIAAVTTSSSILVYKVDNQTGLFTNIQTITTESFPVSISLSPTQNIAVVASDSKNKNGSLSVYSIGPKGDFTKIQKAEAYPGPACISFSPNGNLFVVTFSNEQSLGNFVNSIVAYSINASNGQITQLQEIELTASKLPNNIQFKFAPSGNLAACTNLWDNVGNNSVLVFQVAQ